MITRIALGHPSHHSPEGRCSASAPMVLRHAAWRIAFTALCFLLAGYAAGRAEERSGQEESEEVAVVSEKLSSQYHWRPFEPVERPAVPVLVDTRWICSPIDAFVQAQHESRGLTAAPEAPKQVLLRRVYLDLIGIPPSRAELRSFLEDDSPDAYEKVVDRLLASPHYGERWGRHWMDIWRYSDWAGYGEQIRDSQPHIWRWRDWIVESLNADRGYDRMVLEMLAADELAPVDEEALRATGYLARNYKKLSRETWMQDVVDHTAQAFLGMTLACARCHDHRYDAVSQEEYYRVRAIFEPHNVRIDPLPGQLETEKDGIARAYDAELEAATYLYVRGDDRHPDKDHPLSPGLPEAWGDVPLEVTPISFEPEVHYPGLRHDVQLAILSEHEGKVAQAEAALEKARAGEDAAATALAQKALSTATAGLESVQARIAADRAKYSESPDAAAKELAVQAAASQRRAALTAAEEQLLRAEQAHEQAQQALQPDDQKTKTALEQAEAKVEEARKQLEAARKAASETSEEYEPLTPVYPADSTGRRLALGRWIIDARNPFAARVAVNHIWRRHFGQAIVSTVFDFGNSGRPPTHPALLDWLAAELMQPSWQLSSDASGVLWRPGQGDARPWSMKHLHRLIVTSSTYRMHSTGDSSNAELDQDNQYLWRMPTRRMEAELVRDSVLQVGGMLDPTMGGPEFDQNRGLEVHRRSLYFQHAAEKQMQLLKIFDAAAVSECYERKESIVPQQALALMNGELTVRSARGLARNLQSGCESESPEEFIAAAFETVLSRPVGSEELRLCLEYLTEQSAFLSGHQDQSSVAQDLADLTKPAADPALRARENLIHVLINHNDFITIR